MEETRSELCNGLGLAGLRAYGLIIGFAGIVGFIGIVGYMGFRV